MTPQEARERAAKIHADRAELPELPNDDCPMVQQDGAYWVAHECGERGREFVANIA